MLPPLGQRRVIVPGWGVEITVVLTADGPYFVLRHLCSVLGLSNIAQQAARIREHKALARQLCQLSVQTRGGTQQAYCLHRRAIGLWLGTVQVGKVRETIQGRLLEFQEALMDAADRLLWGEVDADPVKAQLTRQGGDIAGVEAFTLALERRIGQLEQVVILPEADDE